MMGFRPVGVGGPEHVIVETRPHWRAIVRPVMVICIGALLAGIVAGLTETQLPNVVSGPADVFTGVMVAIALIYLCLVLIFAVVPLLRWQGQTFMLTDRRIIGRSGVFNRTGFDLPLARVNAVRYRHTISDRLFGTGTLIVESNNGDEYEFTNVPHIADVHEAIYFYVAPGSRIKLSELRR